MRNLRPYYREEKRPGDQSGNPIPRGYAAIIGDSGTNPFLCLNGGSAVKTVSLVLEVGYCRDGGLGFLLGEATVAPAEGPAEIRRET